MHSYNRWLTQLHICSTFNTNSHSSQDYSSTGFPHIHTQQSSKLWTFQELREDFMNACNDKLRHANPAEDNFYHHLSTKDSVVNSLSLRTQSWQNVNPTIITKCVLSERNTSCLYDMHISQHCVSNFDFSLNEIYAVFFTWQPFHLLRYPRWIFL